MAFLQRIDHLAVDDLGDGMGNDDHGAVLLDRVDRGLDLFRGDGVQRRRGLVQEDDGRVLEEHPRDGDALLLASGQVGGGRVEALRQGRDLVVDAGLARRLIHLFQGGVRLSVPDVLHDRSVEDMVLLQDQADVLPQVVRIPLPEVHPIQGDGAAVRFVELVQQVHDGRFSRSAEPDQCRDLAAVHLQRYIVQGLGAVGIGEIHILHLEVAFHLLRTVAARRFQLAFCIDDVEVTLRIHQGVVQVVEDALEGGDRGRHVGEQHDVVHDLADRHPGIAAEDEIGGEDDDEHRAGLAHETLQGVETEGGAPDAELVAVVAFLEFRLLPQFDLLPVEGLDDIHALEDVHDAAAPPLVETAHVLAGTRQFLSLERRNPEIDGDDGQGRQAHVHVGRENEDERQDGTHDHRQQVDEEVLDGARDAAGALVDARLEHAGGVVAPGKEGHAILEDPFHDAQGQPLGDVDPEFLTEDTLPERDAGPEDFLPEQDDTDDGQYLRRLRPREFRRSHQGIDGIHGPVQHDGVHLREQGAEEGEGQGGKQQEAVRLHIGDDSPE